MASFLSPGVKVQEIDLSIVVPALGNATAAFAGEFTRGPSDKYVLITNTEELISVFGLPTNANANDWFQCNMYLQYANTLLISRAVDANGTFKETGNEVYAINEDGKVEVTLAPNFIQIGSIVKFGKDSENEYKVVQIEAPTDAVKQSDSITINTASDGDYTLSVNGTVVTYTADTSTDTTDTIATNLGNLIENVDTSVTNVVSVVDNVITVEASIAGVAETILVQQGDITVTNITENVEGESYELVFEDFAGAPIDFAELDIDSNSVTGAVVGQELLVKYSAINAHADVQLAGGVARNASSIKPESRLIQNESDFEVQLDSIPVHATTSLKFFAKSSGNEMNGLEIAIARESDFASGKQTVFSGILLNDLFENKPLDANKEIAVIVRLKGKIENSYIVSLKETAKDYRNKSIFIEDIINKYSELLFVKMNGNAEMPESRLYTDATFDNLGAVVTPAVNNLVYLSNGHDGFVNMGDIAFAYGSVSDGTIFGNKDDIDVDIVISNEKARVAAGTLATERADCIAFHGARFEDTVGLSSTKIVENLVKDINNGEMNTGGTSNSYNAYFGNYFNVYDKWSDKNRWVSVAGATAGLRCKTNTDLATWWASAGIERGNISGVIKLAFNPNSGARDFMYKNSINPIVSMPGLGNAVIWGQKTMQKKASSFDRINVRGLFNTLEISISKMAKHYLFEFNDSFTRNRFVATVRPFMESVKAGRGVYDYVIVCDESNNTPQVIDANQFVATIALKPTRVAEFIQLNFVAVSSSVSFNEIFI